MGTTFPIYRNTVVSRTLVGRPFPDVTLRVLDPNRNLVPFGAVGEICLAGKGIARGYLGLPELTAEKFVHTQGQRYDTGIPYGLMETQLALALNGVHRTDICEAIARILAMQVKN